MVFRIAERLTFFNGFTVDIVHKLFFLRDLKANANDEELRYKVALFLIIYLVVVLKYFNFLNFLAIPSTLECFYYYNCI